MNRRYNAWLCFSILAIISLGCKKEDVPVLTTTEISGITSFNAISGGNITNEGSSSVIERGVCWSTKNKPTINDSKTTDNSGAGSFVSNIKGLAGNTKYFVRAYATNSYGVGYGMEISFTTLAPTLPVITTKSPTLPFDDGFYSSYIKTGGTIFSDGGTPIISRGVCWSTSNQLPTISDNISLNGSGEGSFLSEIGGFLRETTYYIRAYATNSVGTAYGYTVSYFTPCHINLMRLYFLYLSSPYDGADGEPSNTKLEWECSGEGDMSFDVYLDTAPDPLKKIATNISSKSLTLNNLDSATTYYWKVYAWNPQITCDNYTSDIHHFTTAGLPKVTTSDVTEYTFTSATVKGDVISEGGATVTERGVYWGTSQDPETTGSKLQIGSGTGSFSSSLSGLIINTTYFVKAYAINHYGTSYGSQVSFRTDRNTYLPTIITSPVIIYTSTSALVGGYVVTQGGYPVTEKGIYWGTSQNPESTGTRLQIGSGTGLFSYTLTGLSPNTTYYLKAYALNQEGKVYGSQVIFNTGLSSSIPSISDIEGNIYHTVKIGNQTWMAENLKTTKYADGTVIPLVNTISSWNALQETNKAYCWYNDDIDNKDIYGALYTWAAAMKGAAGTNNNPSGVQGACPTGWHLPSEAEWVELETFLGGGTIAGGKMKEAGTLHWKEPNTGATNESGFTGLPGDYRPWYGAFSPSDKTNGTWWSSVSTYETPVNTARTILLSCYGSQLLWDNTGRSSGASIRCLKDN